MQGWAHWVLCSRPSVVVQLQLQLLQPTPEAESCMHRHHRADLLLLAPACFQAEHKNMTMTFTIRCCTCLAHICHHYYLAACFASCTLQLLRPSANADRLCARAHCWQKRCCLPCFRKVSALACSSQIRALRCQTDTVARLLVHSSAWH